MFSLICVWINGWVNNREAGDLRWHRGHYDVNVMGEFKTRKKICVNPWWILPIKGHQCGAFLAIPNSLLHRQSNHPWSKLSDIYMCHKCNVYIDGLVQDYSSSIANALEFLRSCIKPSIYTGRNLCEKQTWFLFVIPTCGMSPLVLRVITLTKIYRCHLRHHIIG